MFKKRIMNEINKKFPETMRIHNLLYKIVLLDDPIVWSSNDNMFQLGIIDKHNTLILKLWCNNNYPFKPPIVQVNIHSNLFIKYDKWSSNISKNTNKIVEKNVEKNIDNYFMAWAFANINKPEFADRWKFIPSSNNCLCCESITCSGNWGPGIMLSDILLEYIIRRDFSIYSSKLMQRRIFSLFCNDKWILPDDIILYILNIILIPLVPLVPLVSF